MRLLDAVPVIVVGALSFGAAALYTEQQASGGLAWPAWVPIVGDPLVTWRPDLQTQEGDRLLLRAELARAPEIWEPPRAPDIVVIMLDTVRADRMGIYGYDRETTPRIDRWSRDATVYAQMISDATWTLPSHASLFTGKPVISHGARGTRLGGDLAAPLAASTPTVAGALRQAGYRTVGIAANQSFLHRMWGLSQGFDTWLCEGLESDMRRLPYASGDRITALAEAALLHTRSEPLFLFLNYMDAHAPWLPRRGYVAEPAAIRRGLLPYGRAWTRVTENLIADGTPAGAGPRAWSEAYDAELRFLDEQVGQLLDALPRLGIGPEDYVFLLSDHGEYLGEHNLVEHSKDVYEEVLHVPLVVKGPGYAAGRDATPIQTHDVASLLLAAAGQPPLDGAVRTDQLQVSELYYARHRDLRSPRYGPRFDRIRRAFRRGAHKLILGSDGTREAYDLDRDPKEATSTLDAPWVPEIEAAAAAWLDAQPKAALAPMGRAANMAALKALGYAE